MNDAAEESNSPYETPSNTAMAQIIDYLSSDEPHIDDYRITNNLALLLDSNEALFQNMLTQLSGFFASSPSVEETLIVCQFQRLNEKIQETDLGNDITSTLEALHARSFDRDDYFDIYTVSAQLFMHAYEAAIITENNPPLVTNLRAYAQTLFILPFYLSLPEGISPQQTIQHFLEQLQGMFGDNKLSSVLLNYTNNQSSPTQFQLELSKSLIDIYDRTPGRVPYDIAVMITRLVLHTLSAADAEKLEDYLSDANTYVDIIIPKHAHIDKFLKDHSDKTDTNELGAYLHETVNTNTRIDTPRVLDHLNRLSHGNATTYIQALHTIAYIQMHGSQHNQEALIKQFIGRQLSVFAATTDRLSLDARYAIFSLLNIIFRGLLISDPESYYQEPTRVVLLSKTLDTVHLHAPQHCDHLLHLTAIAMLTYTHSTDLLIEKRYVANIQALLGITEYFSKIDICIAQDSEQYECSDVCNAIGPILDSLTFANDKAEYQDVYADLILVLQAVSEKSTPFFLNLLENSARLIARLHHRSDAAYVQTVVDDLLPMSSLLEVLQTYGAETIPPHIQTLDNELAQTTATFIQDPDHRLHQQLLDLSLTLKQPLEFHAILHTLALRYALATDEDFAGHYEQFKDQLLQQHIHRYIISLQHSYPKFAPVLCDLETELFKNDDIEALFLESISRAKAIAAYSVPLLHEVTHIIATRFSHTQEVGANSYLTVRQQIVSALLEPSRNEDSEDDEEYVSDGIAYMQEVIEECFKKENPLAYLRDNKDAIQTRLDQIFQISQPHFYMLISTFDKGFAYSNIALEEVYTTAPYFKTYFAPQHAIQSIRNLKSKTYSSCINHAIEGVAAYFESGLADLDPKTYLKKNQAVLAHHLNRLQYTPDSLWNSLLNAITQLVCRCLSLFGTPTWLKTQLDTNKRTTGDRYMFFREGEMQLAKIEAHKTSIAITTLENELTM